MSQPPGTPEFYTPPANAAPPEVPQPPSISDAAAQWDAAQADGGEQAAYQAHYAQPAPYAAGEPYAAGQPFTPGQPYAAPAGYAYAYAPPPAAPGAPQGLAITALVLGLVAFVIGWMPVGGLVVGVLAVIFAIAALAKRQSKGMAITGLVTGAIGAITSLALLAFIVLASNSDHGEDFDYEDYTSTNAEPQATLGSEPSATDLWVSEQTVSVASWDDTVVWFAVVLNNPADSAYAPQLVTVNALDASGAVVDSYDTYPSLAPGDSAVTGMFYDLGGAEVVSIEVLGPDTSSLSGEVLPQLDVTGLTVDSDDFFTTVTGTVTATTGDSDFGASVVVLARDADGNIIDYGNGYVDALSEGASAQFDAMFYELLPEGTTFKAYASAY